MAEASAQGRWSGGAGASSQAVEEPFILKEGCSFSLKPAAAAPTMAICLSVASSGYTKTRSCWPPNRSAKASIRRECLDHIVVFGEAHTPNPAMLRALLQRRQNASIIG